MWKLLGTLWWLANGRFIPSLSLSLSAPWMYLVFMCVRACRLSRSRLWRTSYIHCSAHFERHLFRFFFFFFFSSCSRSFNFTVIFNRLENHYPIIKYFQKAPKILRNNTLNRGIYQSYEKLPFFKNLFRFVRPTNTFRRADGARNKEANECTARREIGNLQRGQELRG